MSDLSNVTIVTERVPAERPEDVAAQLASKIEDGVLSTLEAVNDAIAEITGEPEFHGTYRLDKLRETLIRMLQDVRSGGVIETAAEAEQRTMDALGALTATNADPLVVAPRMGEEVTL